MPELYEWRCPACAHEWRQSTEPQTCPNCHAGIGIDYPVPDVGINAGTGLCKRCGKHLDSFLHSWHNMRDKADDSIVCRVALKK